MSLSDFIPLDTPPPSLGAALHVIASEMHEAFAADATLKQDVSKRSCIMCSLTVRDFLSRIGFAAEVRACLFTIEARTITGEFIHSLGIGTENWKLGKLKTGTGWNGHMVTLADGWLIDTTLFQAVRPMWRQLPGMMAAEVIKGDIEPVQIPDVAGNKFPMRPLAAFSGRQEDGTRLRFQWLDQPRNRWWKDAPDTRPGRRRSVVEHLVSIHEKRKAA